MINLVDLDEWERGIESRGVEEGIEKGVSEMVVSLLMARFGEMDDGLRRSVRSLSRLSPTELSQILLQWSREEIVARYGA